MGAGKRDIDEQVQEGDRLGSGAVELARSARAYGAGVSSVNGIHPERRLRQ